MIPSEEVITWEPWKVLTDLSSKLKLKPDDEAKVEVGHESGGIYKRRMRVLFYIERLIGNHRYYFSDTYPMTVLEDGGKAATQFKEYAHNFFLECEKHEYQLNNGKIQ